MEYKIGKGVREIERERERMKNIKIRDKEVENIKNKKNLDSEKGLNLD